MKAFRLQYVLASGAVMASLVPGAANAQAPFPASEITFQEIFGGRKGENTVYCLLGNGYFRSIHSEEVRAIITAWLAEHPKAQALPVSSRPAKEFGPSGHWIYVVIEDGEETLNTALVRAGAFPGRVMLDAVYARAARGSTAAEGQRLLPEERYEAFLDRVARAQTDAKENRRGIWSDRYEESRKLERLDD
jgi:hypothetical protein